MDAFVLEASLGERGRPRRRDGSAGAGCVPRAAPVLARSGFAPAGVSPRLCRNPGEVSPNVQNVSVRPSGSRGSHEQCVKPRLVVLLALRERGSVLVPALAR